MSFKLEIASCAIIIGLTTGLAGYAKSTSQASPNLPSLVEKLQKQCRDDINKHCKDITPGDGRIAACLDSKEDQLSSECNTAWTNTKTQVANRVEKAEISFRKNCSKDVQKFCSNVPSGRGRLLDCLDAHKVSLSSSCNQFFSVLEKKLSELVG